MQISDEILFIRLMTTKKNVLLTYPSRFNVCTLS